MRKIFVMFSKAKYFRDKRVSLTATDRVEENLITEEYGVILKSFPDIPLCVSFKDY